MPPRIIIADDHRIVHEGVGALIQEHFLNAELTGVTNLTDLKRALDRRSFDLLILDIHLPDGDALSFVKTWKENGSDMRVLIFSGNDEKLYATTYLKAGVDGYLQKYSPPQQILEAIRTVLLGERYMGEQLKEFILDQTFGHKNDGGLPDKYSLSAREQEVARLLVMGYGIVDISKRLGLNTSTVATYKRRIFEKLNVLNVIQLSKVFNNETPSASRAR